MRKENPTSSSSELFKINLGPLPTLQLEVRIDNKPISEEQFKTLEKPPNLSLTLRAPEKEGQKQTLIIEFESPPIESLKDENKNIIRTLLTALNKANHITSRSLSEVIDGAYKQYYKDNQKLLGVTKKNRDSLDLNSKNYRF